MTILVMSGECVGIPIKNLWQRRKKSMLMPFLKKTFLPVLQKIRFDVTKFADKDKFSLSVFSLTRFAATLLIALVN